MPEFQKSNLKVLIANSDVGSSESTLATFKTTAVAGEVIAVEADGTAIASGSTEIMIISKDDNGDLKASDVLKVADIQRISPKAYSAPQEQIDYVGFNGTSGSIDVINSNLYQINLEMYNYGGLSTELRYRKQGHFESAASASEINIAEGLRDSLIRNFKREPESRLLFEMVATTTNDVALGTGVDDVVFTNGSKIISATDIDDATTNAALAVGDLLRVGTAATSPVYRITAIDASGNTATLDQEFQGTTQTIADTGLKRIASANKAAQSYGVKISGQELKWQLGKFIYEKMRFRTELVDFGTTDVTESQAALEGIGAGKRVADREWHAHGNFGEIYRMGEPALYDFRSDLFANSAYLYDVVSIHYNKTSETGFQTNVIPCMLEVYCYAGAAGTDHTNINVLLTDLNTLSGFTVATL